MKNLKELGVINWSRYVDDVVSVITNIVRINILIMHIHANQPLNLFYFLIFIISVIIIFCIFRDSLKMETRISENLQVFY